MTRLEALKELAKKVEAGETLTIFGRSDPCGLGRARMHLVTAYQGSLDAALALHEAVLPGWFVRGLTQRGHDIWHATIWPELSIVGREDMVIGKSATPARALLLADIRALIAQEESA
jgi:hypothetical protein